MRINKEAKSLSKYADIIFLGVGDKANCYVTSHCKQVILIKGKRNSANVLIKQILVFLKLLITKNISSVHIINEQLYIFFYPFLFFKHTVLDLFDSIFLKKNMGGERLKWVKRLLYRPANFVLVTDENRYSLMPKALRSKCKVLPNFPEYFSYNTEKESSEELRILYNGWMGLNRGTEIIEGLLKTKLSLTIFMAGWFSDGYTAALVNQYPVNIKFLGTIPQQQALELAQQQADYILCVYAPVNQNNINASPNKVYDAIQTKTPLIINAEVKVSEWVKNKGLGFILEKYNVDDYIDLYNHLNKSKRNFKFDDELKLQYTWEHIEENLFKVHNIK